ncbi:MAG: hypothetical protein GY830_10545 [Bacteroidetes bacterium]|nr:hypothetical protein [Bacteroidota bacterium]
MMEKKSFISGISSLIIHSLFFFVLSIFTIFKSKLGSGGQKSPIKIELSFSPSIFKTKQNINSKKIDLKAKNKKIDKKIIESKSKKQNKSLTKVKSKTKILKKEKIKKKQIEATKQTKKIKNNPSKKNQNQQKNDNEKESKTIDRRSIYNNNNISSNGGAMLEMEGWTWDNIPKPNDNTEEIGKVVFQITINNYGEIINIKTLERTISLKVEAIYREALEMITFSRISNKDSKGNCTGKVTFYIRYK